MARKSMAAEKRAAGSVIPSRRNSRDGMCARSLVRQSVVTAPRSSSERGTRRSLAEARDQRVRLLARFRCEAHEARDEGALDAARAEEAEDHEDYARPRILARVQREVSAYVPEFVSKAADHPAGP